ncbi:integral membrane protein DUF92-domain-containing protein [Radiomyces spectabilis]|uniref:integral membrane protein DUF92-domain-containing protein n=1 Tax=Radiomyces spectabilis TaxID=64574 RepID=UPI00221E9DBF|nr:integral membrane protein DUF92-domain-containing protein [Radiomyces spectabilis]KAI8371437.1 integral membrane protein DUF92-domain-containing protein [Radiomyces spectabilis]
MSNFYFAAALSTLVVIYARGGKSLSPSGAFAAFLLGMSTFSSPLWFFTVVLLTFFVVSSKLTKFKAERKRLLEADYDHSSERGFIQVFCNGFTGGVLVALHQWHYQDLSCFDQSPWSVILLWGYIGHYACCAGDTWASELGILNKGWPILITRLKKVPPGTNGGVSPLGLAASLAGGATIGLVAAFTLALEQSCHGFAWEIVLLGALAGLGGSLLDSLLGATVQRSLYSEKRKQILPDGQEGDDKTIAISGLDWLDNHQVNLVSSVVTSGLCGAAAWYLDSSIEKF